MEKTFMVHYVSKDKSHKGATTVKANSAEEAINAVRNGNNVRKAELVGEFDFDVKEK